MTTRKIVNLFYLFQFLCGFHMFSAVLRPFFVDWAGTNMMVAQGLQSFFMFCVFLLEVPTGVVADILGRKRSLVLGSLAIAVGALVYGSYPNIILFVVGEILFALGMAFFSGADQALLYDALSQDKKEHLMTEVWGRARSIHLIAIALAAIVGSSVAKNFGTNVPMLLTSVPALLAAFIANMIPEPFDSGKVREERSFVSVLKKGVLPLKRNSILLRWAINASFVATTAYFTIWLYQPILYELKIPIEIYGIAHAGLVAVQILVSANFVKITKVFGSLSGYLNASAIMVAVSFAVVAAIPNVFTFCLFILLAGGLGLTRFELMKVKMNKLINKEERATTLSSISMMQKISNAAFNPLVGFLTDKSVVFSLLAVSMLPLLALFLPIKEEDTSE